MNWASRVRSDSQLASYPIHFLNRIGRRRKPSEASYKTESKLKRTAQTIIYIVGSVGNRWVGQLRRISSWCEAGLTPTVCGLMSGMFGAEIKAIFLSQDCKWYMLLLAQILADPVAWLTGKCQVIAAYQFLLFVANLLLLGIAILLVLVRWLGTKVSLK